MIDKPFPMPGTVWQCAGGGGFPPSGPHVVTGLRWFRNRVEAMFDDGQSCAGVEWMMTLDMWQCVSAVDPMPLDVLTPEEQDIVIAAIPLQAGLTRDGERVTAAAEPRRCVAVLATDAHDRVLLVLSSKPGRGWELPGGGVNRGESAVDAAYREVLEETGIAIVGIEARRIIPGTPKPGAQYASTIYIMTASGVGIPTFGSDALNAYWYTRNEVLELHARGRLSDLASREDLLSWANTPTLTPEEDREAYRFGKVTGIGLDAGKRAIAESKVRRETMTREEAEANLRALGQSSDMAAALVRNARAVLSQGHTIGLTAESAPKLHAILSAYVGSK